MSHAVLNTTSRLLTIQGYLQIKKKLFLFIMLYLILFPILCHIIRTTLRPKQKYGNYYSHVVSFKSFPITVRIQDLSDYQSDTSTSCLIYDLPSLGLPFLGGIQEMDLKPECSHNLIKILKSSCIHLVFLI